MSFLPDRISQAKFRCNIHTSDCDCKELWIIDRSLVNSVAVSNKIPDTQVTDHEVKTTDYRNLIRGFPRRTLVSFARNWIQLPDSLSARLREVTTAGRPVTEPTIPRLLLATAPIPNSALELDIEMSELGAKETSRPTTPEINVENNDELNLRLDNLNLGIEDVLDNLDTIPGTNPPLPDPFMNQEAGPSFPRDPQVPLVLPGLSPNKTGPSVSGVQQHHFKNDLPGQEVNRGILLLTDKLNLMLDSCDPALMDDEECLKDLFDLLSRSEHYLPTYEEQVKRMEPGFSADSAEKIVEYLKLPYLCRLNDSTNEKYAIIRTILRGIRYSQGVAAKQTAKTVENAVGIAMAPIVEPLSTLVQSIQNLNVSYSNVNKRITTLEHTIREMQTSLASLNVQITTLNQTVAHQNFMTVKPTLTSDIPTAGTSTQAGVKHQYPMEGTRREKLMDLLMGETCKMVKQDEPGTKKYLESVMKQNLAVQQYLTAAQKECNCVVPDHYLIAIYLSVHDSCQKYYPNTRVHVQLLFPGSWSDRAAVRTFMSNMIARELAEIAGADSYTPASKMFKGCPDPAPSQTVDIPFLKRLNF